MEEFVPVKSFYSMTVYTDTSPDCAVTEEAVFNTSLYRLTGTSVTPPAPYVRIVTGFTYNLTANFHFTPFIVE